MRESIHAHVWRHATSGPRNVVATRFTLYALLMVTMVATILLADAGFYWPGLIIVVPPAALFFWNERRGRHAAEPAERPFPDNGLLDFIKTDIGLGKDLSELGQDEKSDSESEEGLLDRLRKNPHLVLAIRLATTIGFFVFLVWTVNEIISVNRGDQSVLPFVGLIGVVILGPVFRYRSSELEGVEIGRYNGHKLYKTLDWAWGFIFAYMMYRFFMLRAGQSADFSGYIYLFIVFFSLGAILGFIKILLAYVLALSGPSNVRVIEAPHQN